MVQLWSPTVHLSGWSASMLNGVITSKKEIPQLNTSTGQQAAKKLCSVILGMNYVSGSFPPYLKAQQCKILLADPTTPCPFHSGKIIINNKPINSKTFWITTEANSPSCCVGTIPFHPKWVGIRHCQDVKPVSNHHGATKASLWVTGSSATSHVSSSYSAFLFATSLSFIEATGRIQGGDTGKPLPSAKNHLD